MTQRQHDPDIFPYAGQSSASLSVPGGHHCLARLYDILWYNMYAFIFYIVYILFSRHVLARLATRPYTACKATALHYRSSLVVAADRFMLLRGI